MYYELAAEREKQGKQQDVAIVRVEQLAPFPYDLIMREVRRYPNAEVGPPRLHCQQPSFLPVTWKTESPAGSIAGGSVCFHC